jgi:hypothetical protein
MTTPVSVVDGQTPQGQLRTNAFASLEALLLKGQRTGSLHLQQMVRNAPADLETQHPYHVSSTSAIIPGMESLEPSASLQALPTDVPSSPSTLSPTPTKKQCNFDSGHSELHRDQKHRPLPTLPAPLGGTRQRQHEAAINRIRDALFGDSQKPPENFKRSEPAAKIPPKSMAASR